MASIASGQTVSVRCPIASAITVTPGTSGSASVSVQSLDSPTFQAQTITAAKTFDVTAGDRVSITANGAGATYTTPAGSDSALSSLVSGDGIAAPTVNLAAAVGAAGVLTGAYYYTQTFVTPGGETAPWPGTATVVNPSSQQVNLSSIPLGADGTIARRIYRTVAGPTDPKDYRFVAEISDNTTTTYTDNLADGSLGDPVSWGATNAGRFRDAAGTEFASFSDQSTALGQGTFATNTGYASTAVGFEALNGNTTGRRNSAFGVYALTALTTGYENTAGGVHALDSLTTGASCAAWGVSAGASNITGNFLTAFGAGALQQSTVGGGTAIGYRAGFGWTTGANGIAIGRQSNLYSNVASELWVDTVDRTNLATQKVSSILWGTMSATPSAQRLNINAVTRLGPPTSSASETTATVASLPAAATALTGFRAYVTDSNAASHTAGIGAIVAGGGSTVVPVFCDGTNWRIG